MKLILYSEDDVAGKNIADALIQRHGFKKTKNQVLGSDTYAKADTILFGVSPSVRDIKSIQLNPEYCIVASRHRSESQMPALTCHPTGNFGSAQMGGSPKTLQLTDSNLLTHALYLLSEKREVVGQGYEITREVTHHGPTDLGFPLIYVEVGSSEKQWIDSVPCAAVADVIDKLTSQSIPQKPSAIGFGGPHYAPNFNQIMGDYSIGHIMPKYATQDLNQEIVLEMIRKTTPAPEFAAVDWKGIRADEKDKLSQILSQVGLPMKKTSELK